MKVGHILTYLLGLLLQVGNDSFNCLVDTALQIHGVGACGHVLQTYADDFLCEDSSGGGTVTGLVVGLGCHFPYHLGTHVLETVLELHFLGYGNTVLGDLRSTEFLVDNHIASLRTEGYLHCVCKSVHAFLHQAAGFHIEFDFFCHDF